MRVISSIILLFTFYASTVPGSFAQQNQVFSDKPYISTSQQKVWVDSVFNTLSMDEQIAQLLMIRTYSNKNREYYDSISRLIMKYNIGGLTFFQGSPQQQAELTNHWQRVAKTPLLVSIDAEWGLGMRLDSVMDFPEQMTLGAIQDNELIYKMGYQIGEQCRRIGVQMNFAPVIDVNSNRNNPVINFRSFGEDPQLVAEKGLAYIQGLQDAGVIATAKHFPGHGDTDTDSHYTLPTVKHSFEHLDNVELYPFRAAINAGVGGVMVAHLYVPAIDSTDNRATSLSKNAVDGWLRDSLAFDGLAVTDALDMKGVTKYFRTGDIELMAFRAGNDILLLPLDVEAAISRIREAISDGLVDSSEVAERCRKVLEYKYLCGLSDRKEIKSGHITADLNKPENQFLKRQIFEGAVTLLKNEADIIPLKYLDTLNIAVVSIGTSKTSAFSEMLGYYAPVDQFRLNPAPSKAVVNKMLKTLKNYNLVVISFESTNRLVSRNYGIGKEAVDFVHKVKKNSGRLIVNIFGNPYSLAAFDPRGIDALVVSYEDDPVAKEISAQMIFGAIGISGRLPVTASADFPAGSGMTVQPNGRLKFTIPAELGIETHAMDTLDRLIEYGIRQEAYPGCQVLFAKHGKVFYNKAFGYHTYDSVRPVYQHDIYDLASLTKILATTPAVMHLSEKGLLDIDLPLSYYLDYLRRSNKSMAITREILAHQAQLQAWIPFFWKTIRDFRPDPTIYSLQKKPGFEVPVAEDLFIFNLYRDIIFDSIISSELHKKKEYKYSDVGFYLLTDAIEKITGEPFGRYVRSAFYKPMGLSTMGFNPLETFPVDRVVPTELDTVFRKQLVHGYVHDPGAAMLGGIAGHAGLFSNAVDVAAVMQMYLQGGGYGGRQYLRQNTIEEFSRQQFPMDENRRGIGFDKPYPEYDSLGPVCKSASMSSFGHSGFTGTYTWADPENGLLYVFLSNRVYPDAANRKILKMNLRTDLHQLMYDILQQQNSSSSANESVQE